MNEIIETYQTPSNGTIHLLGKFKDESGTEIAILNRHTSFEPYVVAWAWNENGTWGQGYYLSTFENAIALAYERYIAPKETEEL